MAPKHFCFSALVLCGPQEQCLLVTSWEKLLQHSYSLLIPSVLYSKDYLSWQTTSPGIQQALDHHPHGDRIRNCVNLRELLWFWCTHAWSVIWAPAWLREAAGGRARRHTHRRWGRPRSHCDSAPEQCCCFCSSSPNIKITPRHTWDTHCTGKTQATWRSIKGYWFNGHINDKYCMQRGKQPSRVVKCCADTRLFGYKQDMRQIY